MKKAIVLVTVVVGIVLSGRAWACEDGPECQDPSAGTQVPAENQASRPRSPEIASADYPQHSDTESGSARAAAPVPASKP